jgi:hypothetical protein
MSLFFIMIIIVMMTAKPPIQSQSAPYVPGDKRLTAKLTTYIPPVSRSKQGKLCDI